jgi:putative protease
VDFGRIHPGDKLWKTSDPELEKRLRRSFAGEAVRFQRPVAMEVHGLAGRPLTVIVRDEAGHVVKVESAMPLTAAEKLPLTEEKLREQLGRLGGTPFRLGGLKNFLAGGLLLPVSELNRLRREAVAELEKLRAAPKRWQLAAETGPAHTVQATGAGPRAPAAANLIVLVRNLAQLDAALQCGVTTVYCEFEDPKKYREAVTRFHTAHGCQTAAAGRPPEIFVAPPRIFKPGDEWILEQVRSANADGYLARNYDHLSFFADARRVGDFSLNVANRAAAEYFKNRFGLERLTASYDLNVTQLEALLQAAPPEWFEVTIHQHMPMFHMEHCVFCAFLSSGKDYHDCGRPCDRHDVRLRDRVGAEHPLKADAGCRNTVYNSQAQTGAEFVERMLALGVREFRMEFLNEAPEEVARTIAKYRQLLRGEISGTQLWRELRLFNQLGVTRGQMGK